MDVLDIVLKIGSVAGLISILYQIQQNRRNRPLFTFTFEGSHAELTECDKHIHCNYYFPGTIRNASLSPNTIVRLYLVVWDKGKRTRFLKIWPPSKGGRRCDDQRETAVTAPLR